MRKVKLFEQFIAEKREDVGKYNTVKKVVAELGRRPSEQDLASFINDNYYDVTEVERGDDDPRANDKIADLVAFYKFDIDDWEIAWEDAQNESVVNEASKDRMIKQIKRALKDGTAIFKLPMDTQNYYRKNKGDFESVVTEGKTSAVYTDPKTGKGYDLQYVSSKKRWELDIMKKGASIYSNAITTIKRDTLAEIQEWLDGYKIDSSWTKGLSESLVTEAKNTIGLAFKEEQDYLDFVEFIKDESGSIKKDFGWDSKTKSWEVIMDVKVLDRIYGEGTPSNKESGWYGGLPGDFESVIIESVVEKYRETRHQSTDFSKPGNNGDIYFSKREGGAIGVKRGDKLQMIYVFQEEPKLGKIQKSDKRWENMGPASEELLIKLGGREEGKIMFDFVSNLAESTVSESFRVGKVITVKRYNAKTNHKEVVDVRVTDYIKKPGSKDFVEYDLKGKKRKVSVDVFKSMIAEGKFNVTEGVLCEATVEMDAMDPDNKDFLKFLKKNRVKIISKEMQGPGAGTPVITMQGKRKDLENVLADGEYGWDDADLAEYIEESVVAK